MLLSADSKVEGGTVDEQVLTRTARRSQRTVRRLLDAAGDVFMDRGLMGATVEEITDRADLGKGTFYIYFSSKTAVFESLVSTSIRRLLSRIRSATRDAEGLQTTVERLVEAELAYYREDPKGFRLVALARTYLQLNESELPECAAAFEKYFQYLERGFKGHLKCALEPAALRRIAILLANVSSGYLSFEAFEMSPGEMFLAYEPVRNAMIRAIVDIVEKQVDRASGPGKATPAATATIPKEE